MYYKRTGIKKRYISNNEKLASDMGAIETKKVL